MFLGAKKAECEVLKEILDCYSPASRQCVNFEKLEVCFGSEVEEAKHLNLVGFFGVHMVECHKKYLGLPTFAGRCKKVLFKYIKDRGSERLV